MRHLRLCFVCALLMLLALPATSQTPDLAATFTLSHDGYARTYHLYHPQNATKLLLVLHPYASSGRAMEALTGLNALAADSDFAVIYPNSVGLAWNDGRAELRPRFDGLEVDDLRYFDALLATVRAETNLADAPLYIAGMALGGTTAHAYACQNAQDVAGLILVGALMWQYQLDQCNAPAQALDVLIIHGTQDDVYPREGRDFTTRQGGETRFVQLSLEETLNFWRDGNNCNPAAAEPLRYVQVYDCEGDTRTALVEVIIGANNWPRIMDDTILNNFGLDASALIAAFITDDSNADDDNWTQSAAQRIEVGELPRSYLLYVPSSYDGETPLPIVLLLHGRPSDAAYMAFVTDMNPIAEREGFIAVYPYGLNNEWNYVRGIFRAAAEHINDDQFLVDLVDDIGQFVAVDQSRAYVAGYSNGGFMTQRLACTQPEHFAAFASSGATAFILMDSLCEEEGGAQPMLFINGTEDQSVPWMGTQETTTDGRQYYSTFPVQQTLQFWATHNRCHTDFTAEDLPQVAEATQTRVLTIDECNGNAQVILYAVIGGGHQWHGVQRPGTEWLGTVGMDFNSSEVIWDFFSNYALDTDE